jgi:hypothetical protein
VWNVGGHQRCGGHKMNNLIQIRYWNGNSLAALRTTNILVGMTGSGLNLDRVGPIYRDVGHTNPSERRNCCSKSHNAITVTLHHQHCCRRRHPHSRILLNTLLTLTCPPSASPVGCITNLKLRYMILRKNNQSYVIILTLLIKCHVT